MDDAKINLAIEIELGKYREECELTDEEIEYIKNKPPVTKRMNNKKSRKYIIISQDFFKSNLFLSIFTDKNHGKLFLYLYSKAAISDYTDSKGKFIKRGQLVVSIRGISKDTSLSKQKVRTALNKLEKDKEITIVRQENKKLNYTLIEITNYNKLRQYM